jgi:hypothetical protein
MSAAPGTWAVVSNVATTIELSDRSTAASPGRHFASGQVTRHRSSDAVFVTAALVNDALAVSAAGVIVKVSSWMRPSGFADQ